MRKHKAMGNCVCPLHPFLPCASSALLSRSFWGKPKLSDSKLNPNCSSLSFWNQTSPGTGLAQKDKMQHLVNIGKSGSLTYLLCTLFADTTRHAPGQAGLWLLRATLSLVDLGVAFSLFAEDGMGWIPDSQALVHRRGSVVKTVRSPR